MSVDDLPRELRSLLRGIPHDQRARWTQELFKTMDEETIEDIHDQDEQRPDYEVPTEALSWLRRREGRKRFTRSVLEEKAAKVQEHSAIARS